VIVDGLLPLQFPTADLELMPGNPRRGDVDAVAHSLSRFGQRKPIVARRADKVVIAGNHTLRAARQLGWSDIAVVFTDDDDATAKAYSLADNRTAELGGYDNAELAELIGEVQEADPELLAATGWTDGDLQGLLAQLEPQQLPPALSDPDSVPEPPKDPVSVLGDVWDLGPHRLIVGDSTVLDVWDTLCRGHPADLLFTDPPYGMSYGGGRGKQNKGVGQDKGFGQIENDDLTGDTLVALVRDALVATLPHRKPESPAYVCFTWRTYSEFVEALRQADMQPKACIVWNKGSIGLSHGHYRPQHEFIFYVQGQWYGDRAQSDVWTLGRDQLGEYAHPTQKPVELVKRALENSSKPGDIVLDAFGGSGSTLIACHATGRKARLCELDPKYADVILRRYQEHTGTKPTRDGVPHDFTGADDGQTNGAAS
jgi:site-specific DNA-methyltransferase (adenine-specific)